VKGDVLYIVVPCYNEEQVLRITAGRLKEIMSGLMEEGQISDRSRVLFCNDGSSDSTWSIIEELHRENPMFTGVSLSRNRGHQNVLMCGLMTARERCDFAVSMDADLQDDPGVLGEFIDRYNEGCDIVYGVRSSRAEDTGFKRGTAHMFYRLMNRLGAEVVYDHADYRLMSRRALDALAQFGETNLFLRGMVPLIGFKTATVKYVRHERAAGSSKYNMSKMAKLAVDGITSFSTKPAMIITAAGFAVSTVSIIALLVMLIVGLCGRWAAGYSFWAVSLWMLGGFILAAAGITGLYAGGAMLEAKHRPRYIVDKTLLDD
jgi:glycosyltransferase involved in cell wall biosynthesis